MSLTDPHGRTIDYLRVSITERCNLNCIYCKPEGFTEKQHFVFCGGPAPTGQPGPDNERQFLTSEEILSVCREAAFLGIRHLRLTGGEPLLREDCCSLVKGLKKLPGVETVTLTTNGVFLTHFLDDLRDAGIDGINVSLDTLDRERYRAITGFDRLSEVLAGIHGAVSLGIPVKVNCVTMDSDSKEDRPDPLADYFSLAELARSLPVDVRFIEAMPLGGTVLATADNRKLFELLASRYPGMKKTADARGFGPAVYYLAPGFLGGIGFISAMHGNFCESCNRLRLTSRGVLKSCLGYEGTIRLKPLFQENDPETSHRIRNAFIAAINQKPPFHHFWEAHPRAERDNMSQIGG